MANSALSSPGCERDTTICGPFVPLRTSVMYALRRSPGRYDSDGTCSACGRIASTLPRSSRMYRRSDCWTMPVMTSPSRPANSSYVISRSASRSFWKMTCLAVCAPIRPLNSSVIGISSSETTRVVGSSSSVAGSTSSSCCSQTRRSPDSGSIEARTPKESSSSSECCCFHHDLYADAIASSSPARIVSKAMPFSRSSSRRAAMHLRAVDGLDGLHLHLLPEARPEVSGLLQRPLEAGGRHLELIALAPEVLEVEASRQPLRGLRDRLEVDAARPRHGDAQDPAPALPAVTHVPQVEPRALDDRPDERVHVHHLPPPPRDAGGIHPPALGRPARSAAPRKRTWARAHVGRSRNPLRCEYTRGRAEAQVRALAAARRTSSSRSATPSGATTGDPSLR